MGEIHEGPPPAQRMVFGRGGFKTNMRTLHGWAFGGGRRICEALDSRWGKGHTIVDAAKFGTFETVLVMFEGAMDGAIFLEYVEEFLAPSPLARRHSGPGQPVVPQGCRGGGCCEGS